MNKITRLVLAFSFSSFVGGSYAYADNVNEYINKKNCDQVIDKKYYQICYSYKMKSALYVAYTLDGTKVNAVNIKKRPSFYDEKKVPKRYRTSSIYYRHTGYDRGHLANDASFDWSKKSQKSTYSMANIIPQYPSVNRKTWIKSEKYERLVASKLGHVTVVNGVHYPLKPKTIGIKNNIAVPDYFWKRMSNNEYHFLKCFYYENKKPKSVKEDKLRDHIIDCKKIKI